jgi:hypothetical protein
MSAELRNINFIWIHSAVLWFFQVYGQTDALRRNANALKVHFDFPATRFASATNESEDLRW